MRQRFCVCVALLASAAVFGFWCADSALAKRTKTVPKTLPPQVGSTSGSITKAKPRAYSAQPDTSKPVALKPSSPNTRERLRLMDRDGDGIVTDKEFTGTKSEFRRLDLNNDGKLTLSRSPRVAKRITPPGKSSAVKTPIGRQTDKHAKSDKASDGWVGRTLSVKSSAELD